MVFFRSASFQLSHPVSFKLHAKLLTLCHIVPFSERRVNSKLVQKSKSKVKLVHWNVQTDVSVGTVNHIISTKGTNQTNEADEMCVLKSVRWGQLIELGHEPWAGRPLNSEFWGSCAARRNIRSHVLAAADQQETSDLPLTPSISA